MNIWTLCADDDRKKIEEVIDSGVSPNSADSNGYTPLHAAASYAHTDLLRYLVQKGGNVNIQDNDGDTPLHHVEDLKTAKLLIELGADWKIRNLEGHTAKEMIEEDGEFLDVAQYLRSLIHGSDDENQEEKLELPPGQEIRYEYRDPGDIEIDIDDEKREELRKIVEGETPEEELKNFLQRQIHDQFYSDSPAKKRKD